jgi:hypothetical protein
VVGRETTLGGHTNMASFKDIYGTLENFKAAIAQQEADEAYAADQAWLASLPWYERENILENRMAAQLEEDEHNEWCESGEALRFNPALPTNDESSPVIATYVEADGSIFPRAAFSYPDYDNNATKTIVTIKADLVSHPKPWSVWARELCPF